MKTALPCLARVIFSLLCGVALLLLGAPARAQIVLVDNETNATTFGNTSTNLLLATNLTVSASANTLVVVVTFRDSTAAMEDPSTLGWTNGSVSQTLTRAVQIESKAAGGGRCSAIYYLYNPTAGTGFNISGKLSGQAGSSGTLVAYTLSGVDTSIVPPPSGAISQSQGSASASSMPTTVNNITANSWAAIGAAFGANSDVIHTINATNSGTATGTPVITVYTTGGAGGTFSSATVAMMGYISAIAGGSDLFTYTFTPANSDAALAVAVFAPPAAPTITTQPRNESAFSGGAATGIFNVAANGTSLTYQWYTTSSGTLPLANAVALGNGNKYSGATGSTLSISNVVAGDLTNYAVVVTGSSVSVTSSVATLSSVPVGNQVGDVISVDMTFLTSYSSGFALTLNPLDVAGAVPVTNWNNYLGETVWPVVQGTNNLVDNAGANTGAGLTLSGVDNGYYNTGSALNNSSTPNAKLLHDLIVLRAGVLNAFTFTNLPAIGNYDVYVYLSGQDNNDQVSVSCANNGVTYYQEAPPGAAVTNNQVLVQGNNTSSASYPLCNYVVFSGVTPAANGNSISFTVAPSPLSGDNGGVAGVQLVPSGTAFFGFIQQPQTVTILSGQNATFTVSAVGNPAVTTYQWYEISGGATNLIGGATASSYTVSGATASASYFVVAGNGSTTITSSVAGLNIYTSGIWTALATAPPVGVNNCLLLSDGTVLGMNGAGQCVKLTPDIHGSYIKGTWTVLATMNDSRLFFSSQVLTNGNVFVAGGEDGTGGSSAELYGSLNNVWTLIPPPASGYPDFSDSISEILPNGNPLVCPVYTTTACLIYNVASNAWQTAASCNASQDEADWVKLPSDNILTIDAFSQNTEHYVPSLNQWVADGNLPSPLYDSSLGELGAGHLLPDGKVFWLGSTTNTAIYTPGSTPTSAGSWIAGPTMIFGTNQLGQSDAPAAMMVNGKILCCLGPSATYNAPCYFYEYDYTVNTFTQVSAPGGGLTYGASPFGTSMLDLPDGSVLFVGGQNTTGLYIYTPSGTPLAAGQPVINSITENLDGSYHLTGMGLNGISEGAAYGDDEQMACNYPLVRMTNNVSENVYYARTYNWNSTSVMTSNRVVTTEFSLPLNLPAGTYSLVVTAVGNPSAPVTFTYSPPSAPTGVNAIAGNGQVSLSWNTISGATTYNVLRSTTSGSNYVTVATVTSSNYTNLVVNGITYYYVVMAVGSGGPSGYSLQVSASPVGPPPVPGLSASSAYLETILAWSSSFDATAYNVKRSTTNGGPYTTVATITGNPAGTNYNDTAIVSGTTYYYVVSALDGYGESANSSQVSATPFTVASGTLYEITCPSGGGYALDDPNNGGSGTGVDQVPYTGLNQQWIIALVSGSHYMIISAANGLALAGPTGNAQLVLQPYTGASIQLWTLTANGTNYNIQNVGSGQNMDDFSGGSGTVVGQWNASSGNVNQQWTLAIPPPTGLTAAAGNAQISLNWNSDFGATGYRLKRSTTSGGPYAIVSGLSGISYTNTGLSNGVTYFYVVSATNSSGESANSTEVSAAFFTNGIEYKITCPSGGGYALDNPNGGGANTGVDQVKYSGVSQQWVLASMGGGYYEILSVLNGLALTETNIESQLILQAATGANSQLWTLTANGTNYNIQNVASGENVDDWSGGSGTIVGEWDASSSNANQKWTLAGIAPPTPTGLNAIAGNAQVSLAWNLCFDTTGYNLQRSTTSGGPYTNIVSQSGTSYTDSGLDNGTTYYYVLSATNAGGQSANSSEVGATPVAPPPVVLTVGPQTAGQFSFSFQGQSNQNYVVETSTNLTDWSAVLTNATPDGQFLFIDTNATAPARFYRVSQ